MRAEHAGRLFVLRNDAVAPFRKHTTPHPKPDLSCMKNVLIAFRCSFLCHAADGDPVTEHTGVIMQFRVSHKRGASAFLIVTTLLILCVLCCELQRASSRR